MSRTCGRACARHASRRADRAVDGAGFEGHTSFSIADKPATWWKVRGNLGSVFGSRCGRARRQVCLNNFLY